MKEGRVHAITSVVVHTLDPLLSSSQLQPVSHKSQVKIRNVKKQPSNTGGKSFPLFIWAPPLIWHYFNTLSQFFSPFKKRKWYPLLSISFPSHSILPISPYSNTAYEVYYSWPLTLIFDQSYTTFSFVYYKFNH